MLVRDFKTTAVPTLKETRNHMKTIRGFLTNRKSFYVCVHVARISLSRDKKIPLRSKLSSLIFCLILHPFLEITRVSEKKNETEIVFATLTESWSTRFLTKH